MNYQDMANFLRKQADTDPEDAPDDTLKVYAAAAYNDVKRRVFPWPDKKTSFQFTTVPGQSFYPYLSMTAPDMEYVISVSSGSKLFGWISEEQRQSAVASTGSPFLYSADVTGMYLFPTPVSAESVQVVGYRKFADWPVADPTREPDLARGFDEVICWFMLSKYYSAQEDLELAARYMEDYEVSLNRQVEGALRSSTSTAGPRVFGNQTIGSYVTSTPPTIIQVG